MKHILHFLTLATCLALTGHNAGAVPRPLRLYERPVSRFIVDNDGHHWLQRGAPGPLGQFTIRSTSGVLSTVTVPAEVLNRFVISPDAWSTYANIDARAVDNFVIDEATGSFRIGLRDYYFVAPSDDAKFDLGDAVNLSTRGRVGTGAESLAGGFVIENPHRWVLIRAVGPGLAPFGLAKPEADPGLVVHHAASAVSLHFNNDRGQRYDADQIGSVAARVGAFSPERNSKDAACLTEFTPEASTVTVDNTGVPGTALLEIYLVP